MSEDWSRAEVELAVADYLHMFASELREERYTKADHWRALQPQLQDRTKGSIEFKYGNVSAALRDLGYPFVDGYKPYANYQALVIEVVQAQLQSRPDIIELIQRDVTRPATLPALNDILSALVERPEASTKQGQKSTKQSAWFEKSRIPGKVDYLAVEAANQTLGEAGEEFAHQFEIARLCAADRESLAAKVERVSRTRGDGVGFDILSFETDGRERLVEVKTTRYGRYTPFFISRNEVRTSDAYSKQYALYRLFQFRKQPKLFVLPGPVRSSCRLDPTVFEAILA